MPPFADVLQWEHLPFPKSLRDFQRLFPDDDTLHGAGDTEEEAKAALLAAIARRRALADKERG